MNYTRISTIIVALMPWLLLFSRAGADIAMSAVGLVFLLHSYRTKDWGWCRQNLSKIIFFMWILFILISPFAENNASISMGRALAWGRHPLFFLGCIHWLLRDIKNLKIVGFSCLAALFYSGSNIFFQYVTGFSFEGNPIQGNHSSGQRLTGGFAMPKIGIFIARILFPILAVLYVLRPNKKFSALILLLVLPLILITGERTASILSLFALAIVGFCLFMVQPNLRRIVLLSGVISLVALGALYATQPVIQKRTDFLIEQVSNYPQSYYGQLTIASLAMGRDNLLTGVGLQNFRYVCPEYIENKTVHYCNLHSHNIYMELFSETGLLGLLALIFMVYYLLKEPLAGLKGDKNQQFVAALALAGLAINFFPLQASQSFFSNWPAILLWFGVALSISSVICAQIALSSNKTSINEKE